MAQNPAPPPANQPGGANRPQIPNPMRGAGFWIVLAVLLVANYLIAQYFTVPKGPDRVTITFSQFKTQVTQDNVTSVTAQGDTINGSTKKAVPGTLNGQKASAKDFTTIVPQFGG